MKGHWYGWLSLLSLLGLIGVFTPNRGFLAFFGFLVNAQYFFIPVDEMMVQYMNRSAARGFFLGMMSMAAVTLLAVLGKEPHIALRMGVTFSWGVSVFVYSVSIAYYSFKEQWGVERD